MIQKKIESDNKTPIKKSILFLCTGNSCRSQMAEAIGKATMGAELDFYSAGIVAHGMNPNVAQVLKEVGISLDGHFSKTLDDIGLDHFDCVVTVCDSAAESCPVLSDETYLIHQPFPDPPKLAENSSTEEEKLDCYRKVRDEIRCWLQESSEDLHRVVAA